MVNTLKKMARTNSHIRRHLEQLGYRDLTFFPNNRFFKDVHLLDCWFDAVALNPDYEVCFIQAKTNLKPTKKQQQQYEEFYKVTNTRALWITRFDGGDIEIWPK